MRGETLSKKQKGFVNDYVKTNKNGVQAALNNYDTEEYFTAGGIASENLKKPKIQNAIKSIADSIPDSLLVKKHLELLNVPKKVRTFIKGDLQTEYEETDSNAIGKGLDMAYKLKGVYKEGPSGNTFNFLTLFNDGRANKIARRIVGGISTSSESSKE